MSHTVLNSSRFMPVLHGDMFNPFSADHDCQAFANSLEPDQTPSFTRRLVRFQAVCHSANKSTKF